MRLLGSLLGPLWRALRVTEHLLTGILIGLGVRLLQRFGVRCGWLSKLVRWWHQRLCRCLALRIEMHGRHHHPALLIANHVSWLDIPTLGALGPITFLSKHEVREWPVIGWMSVLAGTLFIKRGAHQAASMGAQIVETIDRGRSVTLFPEGTTGDGRALLRFHPRLFAAAQSVPAPTLQPVAIRYGSNEEPDPVAPFIGDDSLLAHLGRVLRRPGLRVQVAFLPPIEASGRDRRALADAARDAIGLRLGSAVALPRSRPDLAASGTTGDAGPDGAPCSLPASIRG
jgi:1-acyl-sn-glycerol-3-phosphate acyltransferase